MAIKVVISRRVPTDRADLLRPLLLQLRTLAMGQPGYISGETLVNIHDREDFLVLSTWAAIENWQAWLGNAQRAELQQKIDQLLGRETTYQVYCYH